MNPALVDLAVVIAERILDRLVAGERLDELTIEALLTIDEQNQITRAAALRAAKARRARRE